jgi:hypothetical protein
MATVSGDHCLFFLISSWTIVVVLKNIYTSLQIGRGRPVDIMVPPGKVESLESDLTGLSYSIMIPDVQKVIDLEKVASSSAAHKLTAGKVSQNYSISLCNVSPSLCEKYVLHWKAPFDVCS